MPDPHTDDLGASDGPRARDIAVDALRPWIARVFAAAGCPEGEAAQIASGLVQANLFGHDSHGVGLVPTYVSNLRQGLARADMSARVVHDHGAIVGLDGQRGFGQAIGAQAMAIAIERAQATGLCLLGLANSHHLARIGQWAEQCATAGLASIHFVNVLARPLVAPWGGIDARLATNPFCVGVPHDPHPLVLDFATSTVAFGKVHVAHEAGRTMADGLLLDAQGRPTNDPAVMFADPLGALLPFGQHKGFALAVMCELLGGALSGGKVQDHHPDPSPMINNMLSLVFVPDRLCSREALNDQIARLAGWLRASRSAPGAAGILLPGEAERATAALRTRAGIPLPPRTCEALAACGHALGVTADGTGLS